MSDGYTLRGDRHRTATGIATETPQLGPGKEQVETSYPANISSRQDRNREFRWEERATLTTGASIRQQIEECIRALHRGELTEEDLRQVIRMIHPDPRQDLLYLQADSTSLGSRLLGLALVENGEIVEVADDPNDWPYKTPLEAIRDGWRVIQFPNLALMMDERRSYGLGCEFILERWSD